LDFGRSLRAAFFLPAAGGTQSDLCCGLRLMAVKDFLTIRSVGSPRSHFAVITTGSPLRRSGLFLAPTLPRTARRTAPTMFGRFRQPERISDATGEPRGAILERMPADRVARACRSPPDASGSRAGQFCVRRQGGIWRDPAGSNYADLPGRYGASPSRAHWGASLPHRRPGTWRFRMALRACSPAVSYQRRMISSIIRAAMRLKHCPSLELIIRRWYQRWRQLRWRSRHRA